MLDVILWSIVEDDNTWLQIVLQLFCFIITLHEQQQQMKYIQGKRECVAAAGVTFYKWMPLIYLLKH